MMNKIKKIINFTVHKIKLFLSLTANCSIITGCCLLITINCLSYAATPGQNLQNLLNSIHTMKATFTQKIYNGRGQLAKTSRGEMMMQRPKKFRWETVGPSFHLIVSDGKTIWTYDKPLAQVTVNKLKKVVGSTPVAILSGRIKLLTNYFIVSSNKNWFYMRPRYGNNTIKRIQLRFVGTRLQKMYLFDQLGQKSFYTFSNIKVNGRLNSKGFQFVPPKGVDIIRS